MRRTSSASAPPPTPTAPRRSATPSIEHGAFMDEGVIPEMVARGTAYVPTLSSVIAIAYRHKVAGSTDMYEAIMTDIVGRHMDSVRMAWAAGVPVATGTDTNGEVVEELELLAEATGANPLDVLPAATSVAAEVVGLGGTTGVLEPGLAADVVVDGDVRAGFEALWRPRWGVRDGVVFDGAPMPLGLRLTEMRAAQG
ncbi:amidohydrolase family protein [Georgenia sp. AZ-5]|uniref:amidohydrolase family protein n=1 Tax=Georgenia sp. AZ-5 TaxID=3367526 RepID=UPI003754D655